jgi:hypothetical protein
MDVVREKLRSFYVESFSKMLKVRTTTKNSILYMVQGGESKVIARFNVDVHPGMDVALLESCKARVIDMLADEEMDKLDKAAASVQEKFDKSPDSEFPLLDI